LNKKKAFTSSIDNLIQPPEEEARLQGRRRAKAAWKAVEAPLRPGPAG